MGDATYRDPLGLALHPLLAGQLIRNVELRGLVLEDREEVL